MSPARLRVAFVSPLPPVRSGISDYAAELLPALAERHDVTAYAPADAARAFAARPDAVLVQLGNDPLHAPSVEALEANARKVPAVVVLHDFALHHLFAAAYLDRGRERDYVHALTRAHGERGRRLAEQNVSGPKNPVWDLDPWSYPASAGVVEDATALIVHSRLVRGAVLRERPSSRVVEVPHHVVPAPRTAREEARHALGIPLDRPVAASLGVVTPAKRVGKVLEALASLPRGRRPFLFVGGSSSGDDPLNEKVLALGLEDDVTFSGYLDDGDFWRAASAADLAINLRHPTMGETSGAVCRLAGFGLPVIVSDVGWFHELPDAFASKIPVGRGEVERLASALETIAFEPGEAERRAAAARAWAATKKPRDSAAAYAAVLEEAAAGLSGPRTLAARLAAELWNVGIGRAGIHRAASREPDATVVAAVASRGAGLIPRSSGGPKGDDPDRS